MRRLLEAYRATPGTSGAVHRADRLLAARLNERGVPLEAVENAFVLAATREMIRPAGAAPLGTIRSLAYFSPGIEEVLCNCRSALTTFSTSATNSNVPPRHDSPIPSPERNSPPTQRAFGADDIAAYPRRNGPHACGVDDDAGFPILFPGWVTSAERYWVTSR